MDKTVLHFVLCILSPLNQCSMCWQIMVFKVECK